MTLPDRRHDKENFFSFADTSFTINCLCFHTVITFGILLQFSLAMFLPCNMLYSGEISKITKIFGDRPKAREISKPLVSPEGLFVGP